MPIKVQDVELFETVVTQIKQMHAEIGILSKSKPDNPINKFKLGLVNEKLRAANQLLGESSKPFADFVEFDVDSLPSNSDVVLVLSQYLEALEGWRSSNAKYDPHGYRWIWSISGTREIVTNPPTRLKER